MWQHNIGTDALRLALITLAFGSVIAQTAEIGAIKGVAPELLNRYSFEDGSFICTSGGPRIPAKRVNDNYCDCVDGSDEPGDETRHLS